MRKQCLSLWRVCRSALRNFSSGESACESEKSPVQIGESRRDSSLVFSLYFSFSREILQRQVPRPISRDNNPDAVSNGRIASSVVRSSIAEDGSVTRWTSSLRRASAPPLCPNPISKLPVDHDTTIVSSILAANVSFRWHRDCLNGDKFIVIVAKCSPTCVSPAFSFPFPASIPFCRRMRE